ncbi:hypothetical protein QFC22_004378 [Naganishia vaughanmartiniae]|uniref:Uncharacterized protein n=1 Tax=Naganishia vaughanmartiniae TaxID=1424756 RepID=A0ACC2X1D3_9TREE|nr:hypothetical protein QFC22_004378 [Naganishia vaughanmartiniae]
MQGLHLVDELSFYDQPGSDALFAAHSPSRHQSASTSLEGSSRRLRRSSSASSLNSQCSTASAVSTVSEAASTSSCSSIEQVFFGPLSDKERKLVAKLGKTTTDAFTPSSGEASRRDASSSRRLRKKDSLDFNRRKTLGFSSRKSDDSGTSRRWQGGLVEKDVPAAPRTPLRAVVTVESLPVSPEKALSSKLSAEKICEASSPPSDGLNVVDLGENARIQTSGSVDQYSEVEPATCVASPTLTDNFARMAVRQRVDELHQSDAEVVREYQEEQEAAGRMTNTGGKCAVEQHDVSPASLVQAVNPVWEGGFAFESGPYVIKLTQRLPDDFNDDSDKENSRRGSHNVNVRSSRNLLGSISTKSNTGHVLQELSVSGASERKSLRDRKGGRAERGSRRVETADLSSAALTPTPASRPLPVESPNECRTADSLIISGTSIIPSKCLNAEGQQPTPQQEPIQDEITRASARLQEVLKLEDSGIEAPCPGPLETLEDGGIDDESFDPDSPLPMSRAPRHSLLLSLTASPSKIGETSPSRSSIESTSPVRDDLLFMPEYHIITTPSRNRPARSSPASPAALVVKTPMGETATRRRDTRTQRREQATLERQATISSKLSAVSLTMSGLGASAYGSSSTPYKAISGGPRVASTSYLAPEAKFPAPGSRLEHVVAGDAAETVSKVNSQPATLAIVHDVFDEPTKAKAPLRARSPTRTPEAVLDSSVIQQNTLETLASRIPKSVAAPTQPVFRKPMISNLPVMKPSLSTIKSSTIQKPVSSITASLKAVRPEIASQPEHAKFATPMRARAPSGLPFRSPATFRVVSAGSTVKPQQARTASGTLSSSTTGATRPVTPGKVLYRSTGMGETTTMTPRQTDNPSTITVLSTSTSTSVVSLVLSNPHTGSLIKFVSQAASSSANVVTPLEKPFAPTATPAPKTTTAQLQPFHHEGKGLGSSSSSVEISESIAKKPAQTKSHLLQSRTTTERESHPDPAPAVSSLLQGSRNATPEAKRPAGGRAMRPVRPIASMPATKPRQRTVHPAPKPKAAHINIISDKELSTLTKLNTARNEVYFCTLDRNVIKKDGPRPPSPNKVRTIAEREEEERKMGRGARAKRRGKGNSGGESSGQEDTDSQPLSLADLLPPLKHIRGAGEDEDYQTPARPLKRTRKSSVVPAADDPSPSGPKKKKNRMASMDREETREEKFVKWDKGLVVIHRPQLSVPRHHREGELRDGLKSCLKRKESASIPFLSLLTQLVHVANLHSHSLHL